MALIQVGTFLLFLVLFAGTGASRGQARPISTGSPNTPAETKTSGRRSRAGGRKEGEKEREGGRDGLGNFPVVPDEDLKENVSGAQTLPRLF